MAHFRLRLSSFPAEEPRYHANSRPLTLAAWGQRSFGRKLAQNLARLLSPLL